MTKIAIIGAGTIGSVHARAYQAVGAELVAIVEPVEEVGRSFASQFGLTLYPTLEDLLDSDDRPTVVSICTPPFTHRELVVTALEAGLHVLCEKPMAHTLDDAEAIFRAADEASTVFATAYCHRFQPELEAISDLIADGRIGTARTFYNAFSGYQADIENRWFGVKRLAGGGVLLDTAIHSIDIFRYLCGEVVDATGVTTNILDGRELEVEHTATVGLLSETNVVGTIDCSWKAAPGEAVVRVAGSQGTLSFDYARPGLVVFGDAAGNTEEIPVEGGDRFSREIRSFLDAVAGGDAPRTGAFDGLVGLAVVDAIYRASANRSLEIPSTGLAARRG
jgi:predicted dehydrogenase